jgi:hypothetical protein
MIPPVVRTNSSDCILGTHPFHPSGHHAIRQRERFSEAVIIANRNRLARAGVRGLAASYVMDYCNAHGLSSLSDVEADDRLSPRPSFWHGVRTD